MTIRKIVLVTGSTDPSGLGFAAATLLATKHDFNVILSGRRADIVAKASSLLNKQLQRDNKQCKAFPLTLDVNSTESINEAVNYLGQADSPLRQGTLDVLINNAGIGAPQGRAGKGSSSMFLPTPDTTADDMEHVFRTNVASVVQVTNALLPFLAKAKHPRIVNVSSARGSLTFASSLEAARTGAMVYNASKAALNMVTVMQSKNLPGVVKPNLLVNAVSPGHVSTPFNNHTGLRTTQEGAAAYAYLATLEDDGYNGKLIGDHAPFSTNGVFAEIPW